MYKNDLTLETTSGVCTRSLVTAILESRRAYQLAMALAKQLLLTGVPMHMESEECNTAEPKTEGGTGWSRHPAKARATDTRFAMRRRSPRHGLRLVMPHRFDSPLVMPTDAPYTSAGEPAHEHAHDRRQLDADQGSGPRDLGKAD